MAISTFVGATTAYGQPWLLVPVLFAWAYATGLLGSLGPTVLAVSLQWPVALLIASALPLAPGPAAVRAGLVLGGGLWQCLLVVTSWTVNRGSAERTALATSYAGLAGYAADVAAGRQTPPSPRQLTGSYVLGDPNPLVRTAARQHMLDLAEEAERIRATLTALSGGRSGSGSGSPPGPGARSVLAGTARALTELAAALSGRPGLRDQRLSAARQQLDAITAKDGASWQWAGEALLGQLRSACRITERLNDAEPGSGRHGSPQPIRPDWGRDAWLTVRASLGTSSEAGRHALRLAVVTALAELVVRLSGLSHGYWAVLTIFIVLRPDYSSTLYRGLQRAAGTVAGAGLGVATVLLAKVSLTALLAGVAVSLLAAYSVFTVNYLLYAVFLTDFVVVLLALLGLPPGPTAIARLIGTGLGTGLAILAYLLWPTWEGTTAAEKFARLISAQGRYARALLRAYTRPGGAEVARLRSLQLAARRARIDAEASADRLAGEPEHGPLRAESARALESAGHRVALACLTLGAAVAAHHGTAAGESDDGLQEGLDRLAAGVEQATGQIAAAMRGDPAEGMAGPHPLRSLPPLRTQQQAIWPHPDRTAGQSGDSAGPGESPGPPEAPRPRSGEAAGLFAATDGLVDAINTTADALRDSQSSHERG